MPVLGKQTNVYEGLDIIGLAKTADRIVFRSDEVQAVCPVTNQPDLYKVEIVIVMSEVTIESKSLKLFFTSLRDVGIFAEDMPNRILDELLQYLPIDPRPHAIFVEAIQKSRGGIMIETSASWTMSEEEMKNEILGIFNLNHD